MLCGETGCFSALCVRGPVSPGVTWVRKLEGLTPRESGEGLEKSQLPLGGLSGEWGQHVTHLVNMSEL